MSKSTSAAAKESPQQTTVPIANLVTNHHREASTAPTEIPFAQTTEAEAVPAYTENDGLMVVQDAIPLASGNEVSSSAIDERDRAQARAATRMGRVQSEQEREAIARASRDIKAVNYYAHTAVEEGNRMATFQNQMERSGYTTTLINNNGSNNNNKVSSTDANNTGKKEPEFYAGTYGKDYEVNPYETGEYDTRDYEISNYKSVYER